jgi:hypothetical protein
MVLLEANFKEKISFGEPFDLLSLSSIIVANLSTHLTLSLTPDSHQLQPSLRDRKYSIESEDDCKWFIHMISGSIDAGLYCTTVCEALKEKGKKLP